MTETDDARRLMTTEEVGAFYHISRATIYRWRKNGLLHPVKIGKRNLYPREEVEALAEQHRE